MNLKTLSGAIVVACAMLLSLPLHAQSAPLKEDFTGVTTNNVWHAFNGACLTAGTSAAAGAVPGCTSILSSYYALPKQNGAWAGDAALVGGTYGYLGSTSSPATPDPNGSGALRFTNGYPQGKYEKGAIVSDATLPTGGGIQVTFKTLSYLGSADGTGKDGADGMSFYLMDGCMPIAGATMPSGCPSNKIYGTTGTTFPAIGSSGGSLGYTCSNNNPPYDGLVGAYLGLGIDEYGNFLNGTTNTTGETDYIKNGDGTPQSPGDNTASGGDYKPGRIGLRGAGSMSWQALNTAYGAVSSTAPYYPASMITTCSSGTYNSTLATCNTCAASGTYNATTNACSPATYCPAGTMNSSGNQCIDICASPSVYSRSAGGCASCRTGTYNAGSNSCSSRVSVTVTTPTTATPANSLSVSSTLGQLAVQKACQTGNLYNYSNQTSPTLIGAATYGATWNPAGIMDYTAINGGWSTNVGTIANESATTRAGATPILYNLKITQDGLLSLSYSVNGGNATPVLTNQQILSSNGPLPAAFRFGFAGSTGGSTNVHEILCFTAQPVQLGNGSGGVNVYQDPTLKTGSEFFEASYFPSNWTGSVTAFPISFDTKLNTLVLAPAPLWDAACELTAGPCASTGAATGGQETAAMRNIITWNGSQGVPFTWGGISTAQQNALTALDVVVTPGPSQGSPLFLENRLDYLRGDTTNEISTTSTCKQLTDSGLPCFRARASLLGDIVDSSPTWVGPPDQPYTTLTSWKDDVYTTTVTPPENSGTTYQKYLADNAGRENVLYVGANDGFLHAFRAGALDASGNLDTSNYANDGFELMAYMPGAVVNTIHPTMVNSSGTTVINTAGDYSNTQYSHAYFVDATPATGDLFYAGTWHTWVVGGLGAGGNAIYVLDATDPTKLTESNANTILLGEWSASNLTCANDASLPLPCKNYLGNTFGTPEIRRFHNGDWGVVFGGGYNVVDSNGYPGAAGVFIMLIDSTSGAPTFYYLPATPSASSKTAIGNGIASTTSLDIDLDHITDFIYAGDLLGNVWKFDVTSTTPSAWAKTASSPLFTAPQTPAVAASGGNPAIPAGPSPISTRLTVGTLKTVGSTTNSQGVVLSNSPERIIIQFGTGRAIPQTTTSPTIYAQGPQYIFGIWDWDFGNAPSGATSAPAGSWNKISVNQQAIALAGPQSITLSNMVQQTISPGSIGTGTGTTAVRTVSQNPVCWKGDSNCGGSGSQTNMGWYIQLPATQEQVIFDPVLTADGEFVVNTFIPSTGTPLTCNAPPATGFTMGLNALTGGGSPTPFFNTGSGSYDGIQLNGTGTPSFLSSGQSADANAEYMLTQTTSGTPAPPTKTNREAIVTGQRLYWIQRR